MSKLQKQFEKENNVNVCDSSGKTFQLYIKWLESKITEKDSNVVNPLLCDLTTNDIDVIIGLLYGYSNDCLENDDIKEFNFVMEILNKLKKD